MTPAAYHRIVNQGEDTDEFFRLASRLVAAMIPLAAGICGDFFVVTRSVSNSTALAVGAGFSLFLLFLGMWFAYTWYRRVHPPVSVPSS